MEKRAYQEFILGKIAAAEAEPLSALGAWLGGPAYATGHYISQGLRSRLSKTAPKIDVSTLPGKMKYYSGFGGDNITMPAAPFTPSGKSSVNETQFGAHATIPNRAAGSININNPLTARTNMTY